MCALLTPSRWRQLDPVLRSASNRVVSKRGNAAGPDPVWGLGVFIVGLLTMAFGGATTRHWVFNIGETLLLIGVIVFVGAVAVTSHRQEHVVKRLRRAFKNDEID